MNGSCAKRSAFTLIELLVVIAIIALLLALLLPGLREARRSARLAHGMSNMRTLAMAGHSYAGEFKDALYSYTWAKGRAYWDPADPAAADFTIQNADMRAASQQMTYLLRKHTGLPLSLIPNMASFPILPYPGYSQFVLVDHLSGKLPERVFANPEDRHRTQWVNDPKGYFQGLYVPNLGIDGKSAKYPFAGSYRMVFPAFDASPRGLRTFFSGSSGSVAVYTNGGPYGNKKLSDVGQPGQKVWQYDTIGRHFGPSHWSQYAGFDTSRQPLSFFDAHVSVRSNADANEGDDPNRTPPAPGAAWPAAATYTYNPTPIDPGYSQPGHPQWALAKPYFVFTRGGLKGVDFRGNDVRTSGY